MRLLIEGESRCVWTMPGWVHGAPSDHATPFEVFASRLMIRPRKGLHLLGITSWDALARTTPMDLFKVRNFGRSSMGNLIQTAEACGVELPLLANYRVCANAR